MYFLWKNTPYGIIRISCEGLHEFANDILKPRLRLYSVSLSPADKKEHADLTVVISDEDLSSEIKEQVERYIAEVLEPAGIKSLVVWATQEDGFMSVFQSPYTWAAVAACFTVIFTAGFAGFFWTAFWGTAAWFTVSGISLIIRKFRSI